ncbi:MAG: hypothetical protein IJV07_02635 [Alphaproteobacteria bacterium]|nr:hypothetical protein [Alphaproteobacteria bacterium]
MKEITSIGLPLLFPPKNIPDTYHDIRCAEQAEQRAEDPFLKKACAYRKQLLLHLLSEQQKEKE